MCGLQAGVRSPGVWGAQNWRIALEPFQHLKIGEFRQDVRNRRVEVELPALHQRRGRDAGNSLGHGENAEDGVRGHGSIFVDAALPGRTQVGDALTR